MRDGRDGRDGREVVQDSGDASPAATGAHFHLFVYGTLRSHGGAAARLTGCQLAGDAVLEGTLYDLGDFPALMLYGSSPVHGEVWRCPADMLPGLDEYEGVDRGLFRRAAVTAGGVPGWTYVAGPALAHQLTPERRLRSGDWRPRTPA